MSKKTQKPTTRATTRKSTKAAERTSRGVRSGTFAHQVLKLLSGGDWLTAPEVAKKTKNENSQQTLWVLAKRRGLIELSEGRYRITKAGRAALEAA